MIVNMRNLVLSLTLLRFRTSNDEVVELNPTVTNFELQCGNVLEFVILAESADPTKPVQFTITGTLWFH